MSTNTQPERFSGSVSIESASACTVMGRSAMVTPAVRKQLRISSRTDELATMLR